MHQSRFLNLRTASTTFPLLILLLVLSILRSSTLDAQQNEPMKALLVTGGCCHDYDAQKKLIPEGVSKRINVDWTVVHQGGDSKSAKIPLYEDKDWAEGFDFVVHNECFGGVGDNEFIKRIIRPHRQGLPGIFIHCSMHSYREIDGPEWDQLVGVVSTSHKSKSPIDVTKVKSHYITQDLERNWTTPDGELYKIENVLDGVNPLATGTINDDQDRHLTIWTNRYGPNNTRIFSTTLGHHNETIKSKAYMDMLTRGILWAVGRNQQ